MKKEFIPYELALRMKELGFDEVCLAYYDGWNGESHLIITNESGSFLSRLFRLFRKTGYDTYNQSYVEYLIGICTAPTFSQAINFLYICSNKQIDIELKASDTYEERLRKIDQGCEDLWNLQNSKSH